MIEDLVRKSMPRNPLASIQHRTRAQQLLSG